MKQVEVKISKQRTLGNRRRNQKMSLSCKPQLQKSVSVGADETENEDSPWEGICLVYSETGETSLGSDQETLRDILDFEDTRASK